ncbi:type III secretion system export apparatus subunit SctV [Paucibacter sp. PLA-PC-4]|uniref:type III secretion system export apparatus subunit SctV n=1 Tax=Paucibacter sp. PLA-PC-4 TaxID=2993655 RepID=UPI00224AAC97|nr:type III secretion system export apparatus subunit SctV [Paucibacter sp. PLA-PC-4]MCX2865580.1 type III secretion system export apparatus subunit SctV [Paucibacter sp. PLA-PC-4]
MVVTIIAILALMVLPLPTFAIDALLAVNLAVSTLLLMVTLYIPNAISLTSFPALLLFTTLFRLALNISSTKLILLNADAGHIIESFGKLVVGGNLIVGIVVFLIITVVQFIVIAKGSERVAEVGARFTLDAMPGKQMSIDADLRAGFLTGEEARARRSELAMESQLHGGMDGAMKFVKGDAIAALMITVINIVAGIIVGILYHGMPAAEAANRFAVLSIGDAMVSQIPSLLICVAAGIMITRVADEHATQQRSLGEEITHQLTRSPRALYLAAAFLCGFALVPGFPWHVFLLLAAGLAALGRKLSRSDGSKGGSGAGGGAPLKGLKRDGAKTPRGDAPAIEEQAGAFSAPLAVTMSRKLGETLRPDVLNAAFEAERATLQEELGLPFPGIRLWTRAAHEETAYEVLVHDVPCGRGELVPGRLMLVSTEPGEAPDGHSQGGAAGGDTQTWWAPPGVAPEDKALEAEEVVARHAVRVLRDQAHQFLGIQEVQWVLERVGAEYPGLVAELHKVVPLQRAAEVLRRLLEEQVPIRNMRAICECLVVWGPREKDALMLTEYVRMELGRFIGWRATQGSGALAAVLLDASVERTVRDAVKATPSGNYLALPPEQVSAIAQGVARIAGECRAGVAVVTSSDIRRYVRRIVESEQSWLQVYSYQELGPHVRIDPLGRVVI